MLPKTWNVLCINVKSQHNKTTFSIALQDYLLEPETHWNLSASSNTFTTISTNLK
jgi:hypothetical protein